jgi:hypothetical protein
MSGAVGIVFLCYTVSGVVDTIATALYGEGRKVWEHIIDTMLLGLVGWE